MKKLKFHQGEWLAQGHVGGKLWIRGPGNPARMYSASIFIVYFPHCLSYAVVCTGDGYFQLEESEQERRMRPLGDLGRWTRHWSHGNGWEGFEWEQLVRQKEVSVHCLRRWAKQPVTQKSPLCQIFPLFFLSFSFIHTFIQQMDLECTYCLQSIGFIDVTENKVCGGSLRGSQH